MEQVVEVFWKCAELLFADLELREELAGQSDRTDLIFSAVGHQQSEVAVEVRPEILNALLPFDEFETKADADAIMPATFFLRRVLLGVARLAHRRHDLGAECHRWHDEVRDARERCGLGAPAVQRVDEAGVDPGEGEVAWVSGEVVEEQQPAGRVRQGTDLAPDRLYDLAEDAARLVDDCVDVSEAPDGATLAIRFAVTGRSMPMTAIPSKVSASTISP